MVRLFLVLSAWLVPVALTIAEPPKADPEPAAKIFLAGNLPGVEQSEVEVGGKKLPTVPFRLAKQVPLVGILETNHIAWLRSEVDIKPIHEQALKAQKKYFAEREKAMADEKDPGEQNLLSIEILNEKISPPPFVLVEGEVVGVVQREMQLADKKYPLQQVVVVGKARVLDAKELAKWRATGGVVVEGTAVQGKFEVGKKTYKLGVKNGKLPIVLTGEVASKQAEITGTIRVTGQLRAEPERLLLQAETIEAVKK
jgi:hypothetical protein